MYEVLDLVWGILMLLFRVLRRLSNALIQRNWKPVKFRDLSYWQK